jgi:hypothetical protein
VVTRDIGAVVLERDEQYDENGLQRPQPEGTATPEPATWIGMALAVGVMIIAGRLRKSSSRAR